MKIYYQKWSLSLTNSGPPCFHSGVRHVWQGEICQYRPWVLLLGLISEIKSSYLTWQNSPKLWKHVGPGFLFFFSFLRVYFLKHPFKKVPSSPIDSDRGSHSITYLISLSVSPKVPWSVDAIAVQLQRFDHIAIYFRLFCTIWQSLD